MPRSACRRAPECQGQMSELSRARNKISALKKDIRRLEGLLKGVSKPSPCVRELIQADDHDNEQTMFELIFKNVITELKDNFISLWKTYQEAIQEGAQKETTLQDTIRRKDEKIASLERLLPHMKKKLKNQKAQLKSLQQRLTKAKTEIETHKNYADLVKDSNAEKEKLLKEANKQLSERKSRHADLEMLLRCCQDSEQELMDKVDEVNDRLCETEHRRLSLETTCLAQSVRLQELEMENRVWKEKCVRMEYSLSQSSPVLSEQQLYNDIDSLMPPENVPESNEENLMGHECPTVEFVPPCPQFSLLGTENLKALSNGYPPLRSKNDSPLSDRNDPSSRDTNDSFSGSKSHIPLKKDYKLTTDSLPELSADRKRARHKDFNPRQLLSSHRKRKLSGCSVVLSKRIPNSRSVYSPRPKPGMKRSCYYRRQWQYDERMMQEKIDVLKLIDNSFTQMCCEMKQLCEAFRPRVEEVVKWVVRHPYLSQYSHTAKCTLFMEVLNIQVAEEFDYAEDVVARWCEGCGDCESSWDNLLLLLKESSNEDLQRVACFFRTRLAGGLTMNPSAHTQEVQSNFQGGRSAPPPLKRSVLLTNQNVCQEIRWLSMGVQGVLHVISISPRGFHILVIDEFTMEENHPSIMSLVMHGASFVSHCFHISCIYIFCSLCSSSKERCAICLHNFQPTSCSMCALRFYRELVLIWWFKYLSPYFALFITVNCNYKLNSIVVVHILQCFDIFYYMGI